MSIEGGRVALIPLPYIYLIWALVCAWNELHAVSPAIETYTLEGEGLLLTADIYQYWQLIFKEPANYIDTRARVIIYG